MKSIAVVLGFSVVACAGAREPEEDFRDLAGLDTKSDRFSSRMQLAGALDPDGEPSSVEYDATPLYRGLTLEGAAGMQVQVNLDVTDGKAVAWLLDPEFRTVERAISYAGGSASIEASLETDGTHYVVFREKYKRTSTFEVMLFAMPASACSNAGGRCEDTHVGCDNGEVSTDDDCPGGDPHSPLECCMPE